ncbi:MAG TPA: M14 family zinc carboxypeptidase [Rhodocyclaceae bacterium]|nr:M14 family zinc carboxypeptidase [Rhodocyclaceae bacterium]
MVQRSELTELAELKQIIEVGGSLLDVRTICEVSAGEHCFPVYAIALGSKNPEAPAVGFFGGFHGLERIGTEVVLAYLRSIVQRLRWDDVLSRKLESLRLVFMPIVNPGGMWRGTRANPNGVDLMRNAPVESAERVPFLVGGQRISASLPWYRGEAGAAMEVESQAVCRIVEQELLSRPFSLAIDCHSGFGLHDRIWFPYAHTPLPMEHMAEMHALKEIFDQAYAHHNYVFEPQSRQYLTHGDIWDYLYAKAAGEPDRIFLPMTLEMGSWLWVKKNPRQLFSRHGIFNPLIDHRQQRVLRRHLAWMEFLGHAASSYRRWLPVGEERVRQRSLAVRAWYLGTDR